MSPLTFPAVLPSTSPFPSPRSWLPILVIKIMWYNYKHIAKDQTPVSRSPTAQLCAGSALPSRRVPALPGRPCPPQGLFHPRKSSALPRGQPRLWHSPPLTSTRRLSPSPISPPDGNRGKEKPLAGGCCPPKPAPLPPPRHREDPGHRRLCFPAPPLPPFIL